MIIPMLCVTIFVILVVWFLLPRVARLMIHTPTAISIFVCLSMVQLMAVFIPMRCTLCGHFLQVRSEERFSRNAETDIVCRLLPEKIIGGSNCAQRAIGTRIGAANGSQGLSQIRELDGRLEPLVAQIGQGPRTKARGATNGHEQGS